MIKRKNLENRKTYSTESHLIVTGLLQSTFAPFGGYVTRMAGKDRQLKSYFAGNGAVPVVVTVNATKEDRKAIRIVIE